MMVDLGFAIVVGCGCSLCMVDLGFAIVVGCGCSLCSDLVGVGCGQ